MSRTPRPDPERLRERCAGSTAVRLAGKLTYRTDGDRQGCGEFGRTGAKDMERPKRRRSARRRLVWEWLEERIAPAITFQFDYTLDSLGFFTANPAAKTVLQEAGQILGSQLNDNLVGFANNFALNQFWDSYIPNPSNVSTLVEVRNLTIPANTLVVYVGGRTLARPSWRRATPAVWTPFTRRTGRTSSIRGASPGLSRPRPPTGPPGEARSRSGRTGTGASAAPAACRGPGNPTSSRCASTSCAISSATDRPRPGSTR